MKSKTESLGFIFTLAFLVFYGPQIAFAGDHLTSSPPGCTDCHGTNIRQVHDYEETIPIDCDICHSEGRKFWYLNSTCAAYLEEGGIPVEEVVTDGWQLALPDGLEFNFDCKACHDGDNPGHQTGD